MKDGSRDCHFIFSQANAIKILMIKIGYSLRIMQYFSWAPDRV